MSVNAKTWKTAAVIAALVCTAAAATAVVGVKLHQFYFEGVDEDGRYRFSTEPQTVYERTYQDANGAQQSVTVTTARGISMGPDDANGASVEQMQSDLEEIEVLRQQDARELVGVIDMDVNGNAWRVFTFKYVLADGRSHTMNEPDPDEAEPETPGQIERDIEEIARLRAQGARDVIKVVDTDVEGQVHRTIICRYVLADGREKTMGEGDPALTPPTKMLTSEQIEEVSQLKQLGEGEVLDTIETAMYGKTFVFDRRLLTLADGTVVTYSVGDVKGAGKTSLAEMDWREFRGLIKANAGESLGTYEQEIRGKVFTFERRRYTLSDGTQVIRADGKPKDSQ